MTLCTILLFLAGGVSGATAVLAWRRGGARASVPFIVLMVAVTEWTLAYVMELRGPTLASKVFWVKVQYPGIAAVPVAWLAFSLEYTGSTRWLSVRRLFFLSVVPAAVVLLTWTNSYHHLMMASVRVVESTVGPVLTIDRGPAFWVHAGYAYALLFLGSGLLIGEAFRAGPAYRRQAGLLLVAAAVPWAGNVVHVFGAGPVSYLDLTSFSFAVSGILIFWGAFRHQLLDLGPVARDTVIESMRDGVVVVGAQGRVVDLNPAAEDMLGVRQSKAVGRPLEKVLSSWPTLVDRLDHDAEMDGEISVRGENGGRFYGLTICPLSGPGGDSVGRLITFRDITERTRASLALQRRAAELEARNQELDAFAHTVAHDLKDPLTGIVGYAELLADRGLERCDDDVPDLLEAIMASGQKMGRIIDELLLLSSVRQKDDVPVRPLDMSEIVREALRRVGRLQEDYGAEIETADGWPVAQGYAPWVEEVWVNLVSNAIKHGGQPPRIELGASLESPRTIRFWVRDNGPGLGEGERERIFKPFTQLGTSDVKGHGLGLSIVQRIVAKLGGEMQVESEAGQGSVFSFTLEAAEQEEGTNGGARMDDTA